MERGRLARQQVQNRRARISAERRAVVRQSIRFEADDETGREAFLVKHIPENLGHQVLVRNARIPSRIADDANHRFAGQKLAGKFDRTRWRALTRIQPKECQIGFGIPGNVENVANSKTSGGWIVDFLQEIDVNRHRIAAVETELEDEPSLPTLGKFQRDVPVRHD
ncbi:MAG TPA: hypothetical protein VMU69_30590 [Bradyrhizobium sp.]|nr:hypothetical protein [Bradyrhizobium sp.]